MFRYRFGSVELDEARGELRVSGLGIEIQRKPLEILALLAAHADEVVTKEELLDTVWQGRLTGENVLPNAVAKLRAALGEENAARIVTLARVGYRLDGPVERIAVGRDLASEIDLRIGQLVPERPNFRLERQLGASLQSEAWLARHTKTREARVYKFARDGQQLANLKREATLFRVLHDSLGPREDLLRIIDWNFETAPFFLESEYGGLDLARWARQDEQLARLERGQRLALFLQVAEAVAAAHSVGVLHKDLKPANVLVGELGAGIWQLRLTDFGSGRLLDPERLAEIGITRLGLTRETPAGSDSSGTPLYLAPELLANRSPSIRSDVYALGIMLYQLLVGDLNRPLVPGWQRDIGDELLCADIEAATDGDPAHRLASAQELVQRLRTLPARRAEQERQRNEAAASTRAHEALRRSRARRPWLVALLVSLTVGLGISLWLYRDVRASRDRLAKVNRFLNWDVLANTGALKTDTDTDPSMRRVLISAAKTAGQRFADDPGSEGWIRYGIGEGLLGLGDYRNAIEQERLAVALTQRGYGARDDRTLDAEYGLASTLLGATQLGEAERWLRSADAGLAQGRHAQLLSATSSTTWAELYWARRDCTGLLRVAHEAERLYPTRGNNADYVAYDLFNIRRMIGDALACQGEFTAAEAQYRGLLEAHYQTDDIGPALLGMTRIGAARALAALGRTNEAEQSLHDGLEGVIAGVGELDPLTTGTALVEAGQLNMVIGHPDTASTELERGRTLLQTISPTHVDALRATRALHVIELERTTAADAPGPMAALNALRIQLDALLGADSPDGQLTRYWLAQGYLRIGQPRNAAAQLRGLSSAALTAALPLADWAQRLTSLRNDTAQ
ncbi:MAG: winged helix-turn-helix domain-containing protein [Steroidobacteraceae bacterium]